MSEIAIRVENLSKRYRIGQREPYYSLRDVLARSLTAPFRRLMPIAKSEFRNSKLTNPQSAIRNPQSEYIWALKDVSFEVKKGEVVGVIGRNGAGKSTLLKILSRITEPTEGYAEVSGRVGSLLEVGTGFHPELTGRENIYLNGAILGMKKAEIGRKFDEIVSFAEVEKFIDTPVKHFSSGMYLRLAFAVAAHLEPEILLVDEVLAVGDAAFQKKCLGKMGEVARGGRTVLFVSHNMAAIRSLCSRALLLSEGQILFSGAVDQCIHRYLLSVSADMATEVETASLPRPSIVPDDRTLKITKIRLGASANQAILYTGQPITLQIEFQVFRPLGEVVLAWSVHSSDNVRLFECQSVGTWGTVFGLEPAKYSVQCVVPNNPLNPGLYTLHVGARCASKGLDYLPDVIAFRVDSLDRYGSLWLEAPSGLIRISSTWGLPSKVTEDRASIP